MEPNISADRTLVAPLARRCQMSLQASTPHDMATTFLVAEPLRHEVNAHWPLLSSILSFLFGRGLDVRLMTYWACSVLEG